MDYVKVIESLTVCATDDCDGCPYAPENNCSRKLKHDAINAINELRLKAELQEAGGAVKGVVEETTAEAITEMQKEIAAQEQVIETLRDINSRLEGKVEAYEYALRLAIE